MLASSWPRVLGDRIRTILIKMASELYRSKASSGHAGMDVNEYSRPGRHNGEHQVCKASPPAFTSATATPPSTPVYNWNTSRNLLIFRMLKKKQTKYLSFKLQPCFSVPRGNSWMCDSKQENDSHNLKSSVV